MTRRSIVWETKKKYSSQTSIRSRRDLEKAEVYEYFNALLDAIEKPGSIMHDEIEKFFQNQGFKAVNEFIFLSFETLAETGRFDLIKEVLAYLLKHDRGGISIELNGYNFFHLAAIHKMPELIPLLADVSLKTLRSRGTPPRINRVTDKEEYLITPLMIAIINKDEETARILIENGADLWQENGNRLRPLDYADDPEDKEFRNHLREIAYRAEAKKKSWFARLFSGKDDEFPRKFTPADLKELSKNKKNWESFLDKKELSHDRSFFLRIMELVEFDESLRDDVVDVVKYILKNDKKGYAQLIGADGIDHNLFHFAAKYNIPELIGDIFAVNSHAIDHLNQEQKSAMMIAKENGYEDVVKALIGKGAKPIKPSSEPETSDAKNLARRNPEIIISA